MAALSRDEQFELVIAFRSGDAGAFERLVQFVDPLLRRSLFRMVPPDDLDDVVQETIIRAYRKIDQFQGEASFSTWCVTIGTNLALYRRKKMKRQMAVIPVSLDETVVSSEGGERAAFDPGYEDRAAERNLAAEIIGKGLSQLSEDQRTAIRMQLDGYSIEEIAFEMARPLSTVKSILFRGKAALEGAVGAAKAEPPVRTRPCRCGCGELIAARGWHYKTGHGKRKAA